MVFYAFAIKIFARFWASVIFEAEIFFNLLIHLIVLEYLSQAALADLLLQGDKVVLTLHKVSWRTTEKTEVNWGKFRILCSHLDVVDLVMWFETTWFNILEFVAAGGVIVHLWTFYLGYRSAFFLFFQSKKLLGHLLKGPSLFLAFHRHHSSLGHCTLWRISIVFLFHVRIQCHIRSVRFTTTAYEFPPLRSPVSLHLRFLPGYTLFLDYHMLEVSLICYFVSLLFGI